MYLLQSRSLVPRAAPSGLDISWQNLTRSMSQNGAWQSAAAVKGRVAKSSEISFGQLRALTIGVKVSFHE